ncbi:hypothetical protein FQN57_004320 [Myotisia sp. PD_48]|nr:hypothetical protein FQN57_004320 [Myotisia sp. PD_48]
MAPKNISKKTKDIEKEKQIPNWPPLQPLVPSSHLILEPVLTNHIYIIRNLLTATLCKTYVSFLSGLPFVTTPGKPKKDEALRVNDRYQINDAAFAQRLWEHTALSELVRTYDPDVDADEDRDRPDPTMTDGISTDSKAMALWGGEVLGLNPNIRIYRYTPGQFFGQHYDESIQLPFSSPPVKARTTWTLLIYLTTCVGGETVFYPESLVKNWNGKGKGKAQHLQQPEPISVGMEVGMALLHRHGDECLLHEGKEVKEGEKWVIRSDLVVKK